jgi:hypothetical protein
MTKEITKAYIVQQIEDKLKLRDLEPERFTFSERVIPVYNIEPHLSTWKVKYTTVNITSATSFKFFTVPQNERWTLRAYHVVYLMTGAIKGSGLFIGDRPGAGDFIYLDLKKGQEVSYLITLGVPVVIEAGSTLNYLIDTYVSSQNLAVYIDVLVEEIR